MTTKEPFVLLAERKIPEINGVARLYEHKKSGARLLSIQNDDENKVFGITFHTPPRTSNGIAHIMEHSVLCGSRKYPVKEPFIELAKGSLNTFLNAFTFPDKTCYPVASQNLKDLYNLMDVYLDAVFYPLIPPETLMQEGWHYEIEAPDQPLTFKGVVFNEMKGAYSSPDDLLGDKSRAVLFREGHPYALDSGGDPLVIPDLTYEEFREFHRRYYHPSNAYIWMYGDGPSEEERLRYLDEWLRDFDRREVDSAIPVQPAFDAPRRETIPYDAGDAEDPKAYVTVNWLLPDGLDEETNLALEILSHILLGTPASPLRKVLIDSGLGEDVIGGFEDHLRQRMFTAGMKGVRPENLERVEALILDTLRDLASEGIDPSTVEASLNTIEFLLREQNTGRFPRGLFLMLRALTSWLYDGDPMEALAFEAPLAAVKRAVAEGGFFERLIDRFLNENTHRATVFLVPDPEEGKRRAQAEEKRLAEVRERMSPEEIERAIETAQELRRRQETPDPPEALATIPTLRLEDLDRNIRTIPVEEGRIDAARLLYHDLPTNGIVYLDVGFDMRAVPPDLLPYMGLFGRVLLHMGTEEEDFVRLTQRIGRETGGIGSATVVSEYLGAPDGVAWFFLRGKALADKTPAMLDILRDVLLMANLDNRERFKQIVLEDKARAESALVPSGHRVVNSRLRAHFTATDRVGELMGGVEHLFFLRELVERIDKDWDSVRADLERVREALINRRAMIVNLTTDAASYRQNAAALEAFVRALPEAEPAVHPLPEPLSSGNEGLTIPAQVNYVGKGADLYAAGYQLHGSIFVINNYLGTTYLWEKIRVQGGAYGGFATFDTHSGVWTFLSYRDPNLTATLENYDRTTDFLRALDVPEEEIVKAIIGTIGSMDAYLLPDAKGWTSLVRTLTGMTDDVRQQLRDQVLGTTLRDFRTFAEVLEAVARDGLVVVLGPVDAVGDARDSLGLETRAVL